MPVAQQQVVVKKYEYYMQGIHTGALYLKETTRQCAWWSASTELRTDWHGTWTQFDGCGFVARFDCLGRSDERKHAVIYGNMRGKDYAGRDIAVICSGRLAFNEEAAEYMCL